MAIGAGEGDPDACALCPELKTDFPFASAFLSAIFCALPHVFYTRNMHIATGNGDGLIPWRYLCACCECEYNWMPNNGDVPADEIAQELSGPSGLGF